MNTLEYTQVDFLLQDANFKSVHNCKLCPYISKSIFFIRNHARRHRLSSTPFNCFESSPEIYHCVDCDLRTDTIKLLSKHIQHSHYGNEENEELSVSSYICRNCDFETYSRLHWLKHYKNDCVDAEDGKNSDKKEEDQALFRSDLKKGEKNVKKKRTAKVSQKHKCKHCSFKTKWKSNLKKHVINKHTKTEDIRWYKCEHCDYKAKFKPNLKIHVRVKHTRGEDIKWYKCEPCDFKTKWKTHFNQHVHNKHTNKENIKWHICEQCDYKTKFKNNLKNHVINKHANSEEIRWYKCGHCDYKGKQKYYLKSHVYYKHTSEKSIEWHKCEQCNYRAKHKHQLKIHILSKHTRSRDIKSHKCEQS